MRLVLLMDYKHQGLEPSRHDSSFIFLPFHTLELSYQVKVNTCQDLDLSFRRLMVISIQFLSCIKVDAEVQ